MVDVGVGRSLYNEGEVESDEDKAVAARAGLVAGAEAGAVAGIGFVSRR